MNRLAPRSAATLNVAGLGLTAVGILLERNAGSGLYPTLALPVVLLIGAGFVALRPGRLASFLGLAIPLALVAGLAISILRSPAFVDQLVEPGNPGIAIGSLLHLVGLTAAVAGGLGMVRRRFGRPPRAHGVSR